MADTTQPVTPEFLAAYNGQSLLIVAGISLTLCVLLVGLRFFCRLYLRDAPIGWDDYLMVPAIFFQVGMCILAIVHVKYGEVGWHLARNIEHFGGGMQGELIALSRWAKPLFAIYFFWDWGTVFPRLSVVALYLRIFSGRSVRVSCWALIVFIVAYGFAFNLAAIFACSPVRFFWDKTIEGGKCFNIQLFFQISTLPLIVSDIPLLLLPIPQVLKLEMTRDRKVGVLLTFFTGGFGLIASCLRLGFFFKSPVLTDPTWASASIILWTTVEPALYCIVACLIAMRPFISILFPARLRMKTRNFINNRGSNRGIGVRGKGAYKRDPALELGRWGNDDLRPDGWGRLRDMGGSQDRMKTNAGAFADNLSQDDGIEGMGWPSREFEDAVHVDSLLEDAIHVKKEVWVSKSPFPP